MFHKKFWCLDYFHRVVRRSQNVYPQRYGVDPYLSNPLRTFHLVRNVHHRYVTSSARADRLSRLQVPCSPSSQPASHTTKIQHQTTSRTKTCTKSVNTISRLRRQCFTHRWIYGTASTTTVPSTTAASSRSSTRNRSHETQPPPPPGKVNRDYRGYRGLILCPVRHEVY